MKVIFALLFSSSVLASGLQNKAIYGIDNRLNPEEYSEIDFKLKSASVAILVRKNILEKSFGGILTKVKVNTLEDEYSICTNEPKSKNFSVGKCTGFLVGPDLLATAGHCINSDFSCQEDYKWIFEFRDDLILESGIKNEVYIDSKNIFGCKEIVHREYDYMTKLDYALIRLDRPVFDRPVLKIRTEGKIEDNAELVMIGHPLGESMKITSEAKIIDNKDTFFFKTNLDSFNGNSGSPIFNKKTGLVEGILVRGEEDFLSDEEGNCERFNYCPESGEGCEGEGATRITKIPLLKNPVIPNDSSTSENPENFQWNCFFSTIDC